MEDQDRGFRRGRGGRRRERGYRERSSRGKVEGAASGVQSSTPPMKTPIILTKPTADRGQETPVKQILIKPREPSQDPQTIASRPSGTPSAVRSKTLAVDHQSSHTSDRSAGGLQTHNIGGVTASAATGASSSIDAVSANLSSLKLGVPDHDRSPQLVKLLDENLQWNDSALEILVDQTDFLVVGIVGPQGVGKSTILSTLAGANPFTDSRSPLFPVQSRQVQEDGTNQTCGMDIAVTQERVILLDTQPLLSAAILDHLIHHDRSIPPEYTSPENYNEIQSLQIVTFLFTVCHVIVVVQDWFTDLNIMRLLKTAEMLKPSSTSHATHESSGSPEDSDEQYPNIVFVYNKAAREDFHHENLSSMLCVTSTMFQHSRLKLNSGISLLSSSLMPYRTLPTSYDDMNIYLLPLYQPHSGNGICTKSPIYHGNPSFEMVLQALRNQIFSAHRHLLTHHSLTERNWFHFAARSWETVRKSSLISEYNRLLCT